MGKGFFINSQIKFSLKSASLPLPGISQSLATCLLLLSGFLICWRYVHLQMLACIFICSMNVHMFQYFSVQDFFRCPLFISFSYLSEVSGILPPSYVFKASAVLFWIIVTLQLRLFLSAIFLKFLWNYSHKSWAASGSVIYLLLIYFLSVLDVPKHILHKSTRGNIPSPDMS